MREVQKYAGFLFSRDQNEAPSFECGIDRFIENIKYAEVRNRGITIAAVALLQSYAKCTSIESEREYILREIAGLGRDA